jgi:uncharacterized protein YrrD
MRIEPGMTADSADGEFGKVADVVIDPVRRRVTHVVVQPSQWWQGPRLVPVEELAVRGDHVRVSTSAAEIAGAPLMQETGFPGPDTSPHHHEGMDVGVVRVFAWPYSAASAGAWSDGWPAPGSSAGSGGDLGSMTTYDMIPEGTAEIRRASDVVASDGDVVGHVRGMITSPDFSLTDLVIDRGHLWRHREITVPIGHVESIETDGVRLRVTRKTVLSLPSVPYHWLRRVEVNDLRARA